MTQKHKKWVAGGGIALFFLLSGLVFWFAGKPLVQFVSEPERFRAWVDERGLGGRAAFVGMVILHIIVAVIPGEPLEIAAGYAFGFWEGTALCLLGMTIGGALVFGFVRRFGVKAVDIFIPREKLERLRFLQNKKRVYTFLIIAFLLPGTPKDVLCYAAGLTDIRFSHWLWIASVCRLPSLVTSTMGGDALGTGELIQAAVVFAVTVGVSLLGLWIYRQFMERKKQGKNDAQSGA